MNPIRYLTWLYLVPEQIDKSFAKANINMDEDSELIKNPKYIPHVLRKPTRLSHLVFHWETYVFPPEALGMYRLKSRTRIDNNIDDEPIYIPLDLYKYMTIDDTKNTKLNLNSQYLAINPNIDIARRGIKYSDNKKKALEYLALNTNPEILRLFITLFKQIPEPNRLPIYKAMSSSSNPKILDYLVSEHFSCINWDELSNNKTVHAANILEKNINLIDKFNIQNISMNPFGINIINYILKSGPDGKYWDELWDRIMFNENPTILKLVLEYAKADPDLYNWKGLSFNPLDEAVDMLFAHPELIDIEYLVSNTNPRVIPLIAERLGLVCNSTDYYPDLLSNPIIFAKPSINQIKQIYSDCMKTLEKYIKELIEGHLLYKS